MGHARAPRRRATPNDIRPNALLFTDGSFPQADSRAIGDVVRHDCHVHEGGELHERCNRLDEPMLHDIAVLNCLLHRVQCAPIAMIRNNVHIETNKLPKWPTKITRDEL